MKRFYIHVHLADEQRCFWATETHTKKPQLLNDIIYADAVKFTDLTAVARALHHTWGFDRISKIVAIDCSDEHWLTDKMRSVLNLEHR